MPGAACARRETAARWCGSSRRAAAACGAAGGRCRFPSAPTRSLPPLERTGARRFARSSRSTSSARASEARAAVSYSIRHSVFSRSGTSRRDSWRSIARLGRLRVWSACSRRRLLCPRSMYRIIVRYHVHSVYHAQSLTQVAQHGLGLMNLLVRCGRMFGGGRVSGGMIDKSKIVERVRPERVFDLPVGVRPR